MTDDLQLERQALTIARLRAEIARLNAKAQSAAARIQTQQRMIETLRRALGQEQSDKILRDAEAAFKQREAEDREAELWRSRKAMK